MLPPPALCCIKVCADSRLQRLAEQSDLSRKCLIAQAQIPDRLGTQLAITQRNVRGLLRTWPAALLALLVSCGIVSEPGAADPCADAAEALAACLGSTPEGFVDLCRNSATNADIDVLTSTDCEQLPSLVNDQRNDGNLTWLPAEMIALTGSSSLTEIVACRSNQDCMGGQVCRFAWLGADFSEETICAPFATDSERCYPGDCTPGFVCRRNWRADGTEIIDKSDFAVCRIPAVQGARCDLHQDCELGLTCAESAQFGYAVCTGGE